MNKEIIAAVEADNITDTLLDEIHEIMFMREMETPSFVHSGVAVNLYHATCSTMVIDKCRRIWKLSTGKIIMECDYSDNYGHYMGTTFIPIDDSVRVRCCV